jgi:hypothetical protein
VLKEITEVAGKHGTFGTLMSAHPASTIPLFVPFAEPMPLQLLQQTSQKQPYVTTESPMAPRDIGITGVHPVKIE